MQTRKRRLESKIDREIGTAELLDAKIKYSQNKILSRDVSKNLASRLAKRNQKGAIQCLLTSKFLMQRQID